MPANYNGDGSAIAAHSPVVIPCPLDGDPRNAHVVNDPLQKLADLVQFLNTNALLLNELLTVNGPGTDTGGVLQTTSAPTAGGRKLLYAAVINSGMSARLYASGAGGAFGFELTFNAAWDGANWVPDAGSGTGGTPMTRFGIYSSSVASGVERDASFVFDHYDNGAAIAAITEATFKARRLGWNNTDGQKQWTDVGAFLNGWANFGAAGGYNAAYRLVSSGTELSAELCGSIKTGAIGTAAFTVPAAYRPQRVVQVSCASNGALGIIEIATTGDVKVIAGSNVRVNLDGIRWRVN